MDVNRYAAVAYIVHRNNQRNKHGHIDTLITALRNISVETSRDNANIGNSPSSKMYQIGSEANKHYVLNHILPKDLAAAHIMGELHWHDLDYYQLTYNCLSYDLNTLLSKGFYMPHGFIRPPKSIMAACALTAVTLQSVQNDQYGGVAINDLDIHLAPFITDDTTDKEIDQAIESLLFNLNSLHSRAGNQVPFSSISVGRGTSVNARRITSAVLRMYDAGLGKHEQALFPNIIFKVIDDINLKPDTPNHDLLLLSLEVTSRRMNPTYIFSDSSFNAPYGGNAMAMGCRTRIQANRHGKEVVDGRGNIAFTTINLPRLAIEANVGDTTRNIDNFFKLLDKLLKKAERGLMHRYDTVKKLRVRDIPFVMGEGIYMGSENLKLDDTIEPALKHGTLSIGFIGLAQALVGLTGEHHAQDARCQKLGLRIVKHMRDFTDALSDKYDLNFSVIGTPAEGLSDRFTKLDKRKYGVIPGITDRDHYTNSSHVPVEFEISVADKVRVEAPYHALCNAGHISYVEMSGPPLRNVEGLMAILQHMRGCDMGYVGFNFPIDFCNDCEFLGVIPDEGCQGCGSVNIRRTRRVTGYFSTNERIGPGKEDEINLRTSHAGRTVLCD
jgi:ribonucleoside-triphosphate reductase